MSILRRTGLLLLLLALADVAYANSAWRDTTLSNGLRVIAGSRRGSGLVASSVFVRAGAARESADLNGAAHFLEHLLFNGTTTRTQEQLYEDVDLLGAYNNATTRRDYALFMFLVGVEDAEEGFSIQADMLFRSTLPPDKFEKERGIVLEEIAKDVSSPDYRANLLIDELLYEGTPLARSVLGTDSSIRGLSRDRVESYYRALYVPNNMTVLLLGDMDPDDMVSLAARTFDADPKPVEPLNPFRTVWERRQEGGRYVTKPFEDDSRRVVLRVAGPMPDDPAYAAAELLVDIYAGNESARLQRALARDPALAVNDVSASLAVVGGRSFFEVRARTPSTVDPERVVARMAEELYRFVAEPVTAGELAIAISTRRTEEALLKDQIHYFAMLRGDLVMHIAPGQFSEARQRYASVTRAGIRETATRWLANPVPLVVAVGPGLEEADESRTSAEVGFNAPDVVLATTNTDTLPPLPVSASRRQVETEEPRLITLRSGLRVALRSDPSSDVLAIHVTALGRSFVEPKDLPGIADFLHRMLPKGAGAYSKDALQARLGRIGASIKVTDAAYIPYDDYYTRPEFSYVRMETLDDYHLEAFELLAAMLTSPHLSPNEVEAVRRDMLDVVSRDATSPRSVASEAFRSIIYGDPLRVSGTPESIQAVTRSRLFDFHRLYFAPTNLVLSIVTSLPESVVVPALEAAFPEHRWPYHAGPLRPWDPASVRPLVTGDPVTRQEKLDQAQAWVTMGYVFPVKPKDVPALSVASMVLSDRLAQDLREEQGLAYTIGASFEEWGDRALVAASMGTRAENIDRALTGMASNIDHLSTETVTEREIRAVAKSRAGRERMRRITRIGQAYRMGMNVLWGHPLVADQDRLEELAKASPADVQRVAAAYLTATRANRVVVE